MVPRANKADMWRNDSARLAARRGVLNLSLSKFCLQTFMDIIRPAEERRGEKDILLRKDTELLRLRLVVMWLLIIVSSPVQRRSLEVSWMSILNTALQRRIKKYKSIVRKKNCPMKIGDLGVTRLYMNWFCQEIMHKELSKIFVICKMSFIECCFLP